jgi:hypothetical protein
MNTSWRKSSYSTNNGGDCVEVGVWRKSSYSTNNGGACVEVGTAVATTLPGRSARDNSGNRVPVAASLGRSGNSSHNVGEYAQAGAAPWRTSTHSTSNGGACVETATVGAAVAVRDTKDNGHGPVLRFTPSAWETFTTTLK